MAGPSSTWREFSNKKDRIYNSETSEYETFDSGSSELFESRKSHLAADSITSSESGDALISTHEKIKIPYSNETGGHISPEKQSTKRKRDEANWKSSKE